MADLDDKLTALQAILRGMGSVLVAFSGGVDSTLLLSVAAEVLGDRVVAATACSELYPTEELALARDLAAQMGVRHLLLETAEMALPQFVANPPDRCYWCKLELFGELKTLAEREGLALVAHAAQADDTGDWRPGQRAAEELSIRAPLMEAGLTKAELRELSRARGLPTWDKPSMACLASRFPYGDPITREKLAQVAPAEQYLRDLGVRELRVRHHGSVARIELSPDDFPMLLDPETRARLIAAFRDLGFTYVTLDLAGFRSGSMNETLNL